MSEEAREEVISRNFIENEIDKDLAEEIWTDRPALPCHDIYVLSDELCGRSFKDKLSEVRKKMEEKETSSHLLSKHDDIMWRNFMRERHSHEVVYNYIPNIVFFSVWLLLMLILQWTSSTSLCKKKRLRMR